MFDISIFVNYHGGVYREVYNLVGSYRITNCYKAIKLERYERC